MRLHRRQLLAGTSLLLAGCAGADGADSDGGTGSEKTTAGEGCGAEGVEARIRITPHGVTAVLPGSVQRGSLPEGLATGPDSARIYRRDDGSRTVTYVVFGWVDGSPDEVREAFVQAGLDPEVVRSGVGPDQVDAIEDAIRARAAAHEEVDESTVTMTERVDGDTQHLYFATPGDLRPLVPVLTPISVNWATEFSGQDIGESRALFGPDQFDLERGFDFRIDGASPGFVFHVNEEGVDRLRTAIEETGRFEVTDRSYLQLTLEGEELSSARFSPNLVETILDGSWEGRLVFPVGNGDQKAILEAAGLPRVPVQLAVVDC